GQPGAQGRGEGLGQDGEHDVEVDVEVDGGGQRVGAERADDLGEPLFDGHPAGVPGDEVPGGDLVVVGDDDGGVVPAQAGDDELADGGGVAGELDGGVLVHAGPVVRAGPVQGDGGEARRGQAGDVGAQRPGPHP